MGFFNKIKEGLKKTRESIFKQVDDMLGSFHKIDDDLYEELEEILIMSDVGAATSSKICLNLKKKVKEQKITEPLEVRDLLKNIISEMMTGNNEMNLNTKPSVILVIGVNGAGKTTAIGKISAYYKSMGKDVLVAAADTFRAAAIEQLEVWVNRAGVSIIKHAEGSDPAAVIFDAAQAAKHRKVDLLICDTAGRLQNKKNLMDELSKIVRVLRRELPESDIEVLLVLDATTGQNAVSQAKLFNETADITGIVLTKLDGTAKGGVVIAINDELSIPVKFIGVGEKIDDLQPFVPSEFVNALFDNGASE